MKFFISLVLVYIFLTGCGTSSTSSSSSSNKEISFSGVVVDGYISGANVCLDLNKNGSCDLDEPAALTSSSGAFTIKSSAGAGDTLLSIVATGGKDTATNKNFTGKLKSIVDTNTVSQTEPLFITPLTDLIATSFLASATKTSAALLDTTTKIANGYSISTSFVNKSPMAYAGVFSVAQEIQQSVSLMQVTAAKAKGVNSTALEQLQLSTEIKQAIVAQISEDGTLNISNVLTKLELLSNIIIPENEKAFLVAQIREMKVAIYAFGAIQNLTPSNLNAYQAALETEVEKATTALKNAKVGENITPIIFNIDIFTKEVSLSGIVVDGYISGANVCLDLNENGACDFGEPVAMTSSGGEFNLTASVGTGITFLPVVATGGRDTATNKNFTGKFKSIIDTKTVSQTEPFFITPLTDLIATSFLASSIKTSATLLDAITQISNGYTISTSYANKSPMVSPNVFSVAQEIQQNILLIQVAAAKAKGASLTALEQLQLGTEIKKAIVTQISEDGTLNISNVLTKLELLSNITIPENEKAFLVAQIREIKVAIYAFGAIQNLTPTNLNAYQAALETEVEKATTALENATVGENIAPIIFNIDIFKVATDTNATDTNTTIPVDDNITSISFGGVMVDGYISGATLCLDLNNDGICAISEPSVKTLADGNFTFSSIKVQKNMLIPIIGFGGTDSATNKLFQGELKNMIDVNNTSINSAIAITPFTDLAQVLFSKSTMKDKTALEASVKSIADAFGMKSEAILKDTMLDVGIFAKSQEIQHIKTLIEFITKRTLGKTLTTTQKILIKNALIIQLVESGYETMSLKKILVALQIDLKISFSESDITLVISQATEIRRVLSTLAKDKDIYIWTLPRMQSMIETALELAYSNAHYVDLNVTVASVTQSLQSKKDALFDAQACLQNVQYKNILSDSNSTAERTDDVVNGISVSSDYDSVTLYYPDLGIAKSNENVVVFKDNYYFSFDKAWIKSDKQVYIRTPKDSSGLYGCYRTKLNSDIASQLELLKVYRYEDSQI